MAFPTEDDPKSKDSLPPKAFIVEDDEGDDLIPTAQYWGRRGWGGGWGGGGWGRGWGGGWGGGGWGRGWGGGGWGKNPIKCLLKFFFVNLNCFCCFRTSSSSPLGINRLDAV